MTTRAEIEKLRRERMLTAFRGGYVSLKKDGTLYITAKGKRAGYVSGEIKATDKRSCIRKKPVKRLSKISVPRYIPRIILRLTRPNGHSIFVVFGVHTSGAKILQVTEFTLKSLHKKYHKLPVIGGLTVTDQDANYLLNAYAIENR